MDDLIKTAVIKTNRFTNSTQNDTLAINLNVETLKPETSCYVAKIGEEEVSEWCPADELEPLYKNLIDHSI